MAITPVDISTFTPEQKKLYASAAALGTGVPTYDAASQYGPVSSPTTSASGAQGGTSTTTPPSSSTGGTTMGDLFGGVPSAPTTDPTASSIYDGYKSDATSVVDPVTIRKEVANRFQDRIDAINNVFAQKLKEVDARVGQENAVRTGQTTAILANRGLGGSIRGAAISDNTATQNREILSSEEAKVNAEKTANLMQLYGQIDNAVNSEVAAKTEAKRQGAAAYLEFIKGQGEKKTTYANQIGAYLYQNNIDPTTLSADEISKLVAKGGSLGITQGDIMSAYGSAKASAQAEKQKQQDAIDKALAQKGYIKDPTTGDYRLAVPEADKPMIIPEGSAVLGPDGKVIFKNPKTFAPKATGNAALRLSAGQKDDLSTMDTVKELSSQLLTLAGPNKKLPGVGANGFGSAAGALANAGVGSEQGQHVRDLIGNIKGTIAKLRGGTSFTPNEEALLNSYTPTINDPDWVIVQKLNDLNAYIETKKKNLLSTASYGDAIDPGTNVGTVVTAPDGSTVEIVD